MFVNEKSSFIILIGGTIVLSVVLQQFYNNFMLKKCLDFIND
mgnify:CR=1